MPTPRCSAAPTACRAGIDFFGADKVVFASDAPLAPIPVHVKVLDQVSTISTPARRTAQDHGRQRREAVEHEHSSNAAIAAADAVCSLFSHSLSGIFSSVVAGILACFRNRCWALALASLRCGPGSAAPRARSRAQPSFYRSMASAGAQLDAKAAASMISGYRRNNGLPPVTLDPALMRLAEAQARAMAERDRFSHNTGGAAFIERLQAVRLRRQGRG